MKYLWVLIFWLIILIIVTVFFGATSHAEGFDRKYWSAAGITVAAIGADFGSTIALVGHGSCPVEAYSPWMYGRRAAPARVGVTMALEASVALGVGYWAKKHNKRLWWAPMAYMSAVHSRGLANNLQHCR